jgi:hypothetical protein
MKLREKNNCRKQILIFDFYPTGESARFSLRKNRNFVINKNFDDGGR